MLDALANLTALRPLRRWLMARLPFPVLASDVQDIVYLNWVVPGDRVQALVPAGVRILERDGSTILTVLTYRHGHFGPALPGPLRRLFPSPRQSNWRLYLEGPGQPTVLFLANIFDSALYAVGTRLFSDALPSHLAGAFRHDCREGRCETSISGSGSAPSLHAVTHDDPDARRLPADFAPFFADWNAAVAALCLQDRAVARVPGEDAVAWADIALPVDPGTVAPARCALFQPGEWIASIVGDAMPFCFRVPAVPFRVTGEGLMPRR